jgi:hypothetical protein
MSTIQELQKEIKQIKTRNRRVELDKAWEVSWTRKFIIFILTYIVIVILFFIAKLPEPFINAIVPSVAFILSTFTVPIIKKWWIKAVDK